MPVKTLCRLLLFLTLCAGALAAVGQTNVGPSNPILQHADPFITWMPVDGRYLLLATARNNVTIWSGPTPATAATDSKVVFNAVEGMREVWSPTLWHIKGSWWIYFTARVGTEKHAIYVLQSDTDDPLGTYTYRGPLDLEREAIDPSVLTVKGKTYLMYVGVGGGENAIYMVRLGEPMKPVGEKVLIAEPEYPWEKGAGSPKNYPVNEGPTALYHAGKAFIVYSGSDTASTFYCLGLLTFQGGDPLQRRNWIKTDHPILTQNPAVGIVGTGRGTFAHAKDGTEWLLYAAMPADDARTANRATRAQRFTWNADGSPEFGPVLADGPIAVR
ncbi:putative beta-xylosidase [Terriglobus roseus DSM 18391]|uniref:Putative beta-xylosidase n=1 Tax=Terriglobus roseus (strain DSM 18391 / NRRL B-41598 / KBS 63) TaxID=926566 RepID=I3ZKS8_TERRK|nr:glycoside hydrolase family 43 protein [Terriglobus roseus]AFL89846.1 putative beta-xylosidase [Terriglobus roseus DSM 18391]